MNRVNRLIQAGWTVENWGGRYVIMTRPGARRIVCDIYWNCCWVSGFQEVA